jgi:glycosyltransferase involved in cell wall biosynthesis
MRIAVDATCLWNRRGFGRFAVQLLGALLHSEPRHQYVLLVDREPQPGDLPEGCEVVNARPQRKVTESAVAGDHRTVGDMLRFTRVAGKVGADLFFFPAVYSYFPVPRGSRSVVCFHDTIAESFPELVFPNWANRLAWRAKVRLALWQCTRLMTVSEASRQALVEHFRVPSERIDVITEAADPRFHGSSDPDRVQQALERVGIPPERPYLLYVGGISPHKNLATLLQAMPAVLTRERVTLVMVGDLNADGFLDDAEPLRRQIAADPRLQESCLFTGYVSDDDLVDLYRGAYALVLPSLLEGFGLPAVEAMASGIPVLASNTGSLPEVIGSAGLLFDPRDSESMAKALLQLLGDAQLRDRLSVLAREQAGKFSWQRGAELALESFARAVA